MWRISEDEAVRVAELRKEAPGDRSPSDGGIPRLTQAASVADDAVAVPVAHVPVRWVAPRHRRDAVPAGLGARDAAVAVVVVESERIAGYKSLTGHGAADRVAPLARPEAQVAVADLLP